MDVGVIKAQESLEFVDREIRRVGRGGVVEIDQWPDRAIKYFHGPPGDREVLSNGRPVFGIEWGLIRWRSRT